jgi:CelD/BcsL family acetyltransferase involved in cellulose biosynthesis
MTAELIDDLRSLQSFESDWDELADECGAPYCTPLWMLTWWRRVARPGARLRVVVLHDDAELIGVAPFFVDSGPAGIARYRLLGSGSAAPIQPLVRPGKADQVASLIAPVVASADPPPDLVTLEGIPARSRWAGLLAEAWPGSSKPWLHRDMSLVAPTLTLSAEGYEEWLKSKSSNFRQQMNRSLRRLTKRGATFHLARTEPELKKGIDDFVHLHRSRWDARGGSNALDPGVVEMLRDVANDPSGSTRMRLWTIQADGHAITTQIFIAAGGVVAYWNGGFDEGWGSERPSLQAILAAIQQAWSEGDRQVDFGGGAHDYKLRFADGEEQLEWATLVPAGRRHLLVRLLLIPDHLRRLVTARLSYETKLKLKHWLHPRGRHQNERKT